MKRRVALLMDAAEDDYQVGILRGISRAAEPTNIQLVCLAGGVVGDPLLDYRAQRNFLFDLLGPLQFEGMLALSGTLGNLVGAANFAQFLGRFDGIPIVNLGVRVSGMHSISVAGGTAMGDVIRHLIKVHGHRRIALIRGPSTNEDAEERYAAYRSALDESGIALEPRLILQGNWRRESGSFAVRELFEDRGVRVGAVDAVAAANDYMALGALDALAERGVTVPSDVAVTGFDDLDITRTATPSLTTVRRTTDALGREGLRRLVSLMNGSAEPFDSELAAQIVERRSCGCARVDVQRTRPGTARDRGFEAAIIERRTLICAALARGAHGAMFGVGSGWEQRLLAALLNDLMGQGPSIFLSTIDQIIVRLHRAGGDLSVCQTVLGLLRGEIADCASADASVGAHAEDLFHAARDQLAEAMVRTEISRKVDAVSQLREFAQASSLLFGTATLAVIREQFELRFRALGIPAFALGVFEEPGKVSRDCLCLAAYSSIRRFRIPETFRANEFGPADLFSRETGALLVQPLVFEGRPMGIVTVMLSTLDISIFEQLRLMLGAAVHGFHLARSGRG